MRINRVALFGFIIALSGGLLSFCWNVIFNFVLSKTIRLTPGSSLTKQWKDPEVPLYTDIYLFNWTNPEQLYDENFVPNVVELGPYSFRDVFSRVNVKWNKNKTVSFRRRRFWYFDPTRSARPLSDNITLINPVALSAAHVSRFNNYLLQLSVSGALKVTGQKLWITGTAGEVLFDGYDDPLVKIASKLVKNEGVTYDKFGFFYMKNGSSVTEGYFNVNTGEDDFTKIGIMRYWNYMNRTDFYQADCGMINGSDGSFYPPGNPKEKPIEMYTVDFCRTLKFHYVDDREVEGIPSYRYVGTKMLLDSGELDPENWCFCGGECLPPGVLNISSCARGAPVFISYPHFLHADPYYLKQVRGLDPSEEKHQFHIIVEPTTGFPLEVTGRFQFNFMLQPNENIGMYSKVPRVLFPVLWCEEIARITPEFASGLKLLLAVPTIGLCLSLALVVIGLILLAVAFMRIKRNRRDQNGQQMYSMVNTKPLEDQRRHPLT
ncbi:hypothetical protein L9F63_010915 [Diploptera punctata]|uniref:Uncharacterized protein n=1 Tax=Diploptera punctata TaxID=6984 RepID=A0AAD8EQ16_DIPPU|nr:hypothetical protein L9F63_010915 [Diploptera punctata]